MRTGSAPVLGVVIPALDEEERLPLLLQDLERLALPHRVVVADGGSADDTPDRARERGARVIHAPRGRASQMNAGALSLSTPWLLFLHADSRMPPRTARVLLRWLEEASPRTAGHFRFSLEGEDRFWRFIEFGQSLRERLSGLVYGDQGLVVSRALFREVGGVPDQPLMEDVELVRRLRRAGHLESLDAPLPTSPRRYIRDGKWRGWLRNTALIGLYLSGVPADRLAGWYPDGSRASTPGVGGGERGPERTAAASRRTLLVFAKAPEAGRVKTRLAADLGVTEATRLYRHLGRRVISQLRGGSYRTVVHYDPPGSEATVRAWLGGGPELQPQVPGDLGRRMEQGLHHALEDADAACVVGTDAPRVDRARVEEAFRALEGADVVFGPARDGGYYLVAMREVHPLLFKDVPWSTSAVLARSLDRAEESGLRIALLPPLTDVDTAEDASVELLREAGVQPLGLAASALGRSSSSAHPHTP